MNVARRQRRHQVDAVLLMGGNIRGNVSGRLAMSHSLHVNSTNVAKLAASLSPSTLAPTAQADYELGSFFSLEALEAEIKSDETVAVVPMPGWLLAKGVQETHAGDPISGWMQYDQGVQEDTSVHPPVVTHVAGEPLDENRVYRVATKVSDLTNGQSPSWTTYYRDNPQLLPPKGAYVNIHADLMGYFSRNLFRKLWDAISQELPEEECSVNEACHAEERLAALDLSGDGVVTVAEIQAALKEKLGYSVDERETSLAEFVHNYADTTGDGKITVRDIEAFCREMEDLYESDKWRLSYAKGGGRRIPEKEPVSQGGSTAS